MILQNIPSQWCSKPGLNVENVLIICVIFYIKLFYIMIFTALCKMIMPFSLNIFDVIWIIFPRLNIEEALAKWHRKYPDEVKWDNKCSHPLPSIFSRRRMATFQLWLLPPYRCRQFWIECFLADLVRLLRSCDRVMCPVAFWVIFSFRFGQCG